MFRKIPENELEVCRYRKKSDLSFRNENRHWNQSIVEMENSNFTIHEFMDAHIYMESSLFVPSEFS